MGRPSGEISVDRGSGGGSEHLRSPKGQPRSPQGGFPVVNHPVRSLQISGLAQLSLSDIAVS